ncbi:TerC family protein [Buchnera aphidicola]|uniref:TerC family protein n=1 Tax=Buchnera aphidicola TaxID=9 RepID=UPI00346403B7
MHTIGTPFLWITFSMLSIVMILSEIVLQKTKIFIKKPLKSSILFSLLWLSVVFLFSIILWFSVKKNININIANVTTLSFFSSYFLEQLLSVDNILIWFLLFRHFSIPIIYHRKVLVYGLLGATVFRIMIIFFGNWFLYKYNWILYVFGIIVLYTGVKMIFLKNNNTVILPKNRRIVWIYRILRITSELKKDKFFLWENGVFFFTPLFLVSILIELSDIIFAIDSISAVFSITTDPFIIITSNLLSIFNLRSMYFLLSFLETEINFIKYGIGFVLIFIGFKILFGKFLCISEYFYMIIIGFFLIISIFLNIFYIVKKMFFKKK